MSIWMKLGRLLPRNREGKWPLPVQLAVFVLIEALFIWGLNESTMLIYGANTGADPTLWVLLAGTVLCLVRMALHWAVPFGEWAQKRWMVLPWTLGYGALNVLMSVLPQALAGRLPLPTESLMAYTVAHWLLYAGLACVFCALLNSLRVGDKLRAGRLTAVGVLLAGLLILCSACSWQVEENLGNEALMAAQEQPVVVTTFGDAMEITGDELAAMLESSGVEGRVVIVNPDMTTEAPADPFTDYEAAMQLVNRLSSVLMWAMRIPLFFAMKRWLFAKEQEEAVCT